MVIYAIVGGLTRRVKIGRTSGSALGRMSDLQPSSPDSLSLLASAPGRNRGDEPRLHEYFARYRLHHEWFAPAVTELIEAALCTMSFGNYIDEIAREVDFNRSRWHGSLAR